MTESKLHDKIAKILRLAQDPGATEGEKEAALRAAQSFAFKYNLDLSTVNLDTDKDTKIGDHEVGEDYDEEWKHQLIMYVTRVNFCRVWFYDKSYQKRGRMRAVVVGRPHNVDVVKQMMAFLLPQMESQALREVVIRGQCPRYALVAVAGWLLKHPQFETLEEARLDLVPLLKGDTGLQILMDLTSLTKAYCSEIRPWIKRGEIAPEVVKDLKSWRYSFEMAQSYRVGARLQEAYMQAKNDAGDNGQALVVRETQALAEYMESKDLEDMNESNRRWDMGAYKEGTVAGDKVNIHKRAGLTNTGARELNS